MMNLLAFHVPFLDQNLVLIVIGLLLFGKRLPEVGRSLGKGIIEFKRGLKGIEEDVEEASSVPASALRTQPSLPVTTTAPAYKFDPVTGQAIAPPPPTGAKFDPYTGKPIVENPPAV